MYARDYFITWPGFANRMLSSDVIKYSTQN